MFQLRSQGGHFLVSGLWSDSPPLYIDPTFATVMNRFKRKVLYSNIREFFQLNTDHIVIMVH
jgi:hypothetical protein